MYKFFGVLFSVFMLFSANAEARKEACTHVHPENCGNAKEEQVRRDKFLADQAHTQKAHTPLYAEALGYAGDPNKKPTRQGICNSDGVMGATGNNNWCKEYKDKKGEDWRVVFDTNTAPIKIIRLSDNADVTFDWRGKVIADNIKQRSSAQTQEASKESSQPAQETQKADPADVAKKALGSIFKGL